MPCASLSPGSFAPGHGLLADDDQVRTVACAILLPSLPAQKQLSGETRIRLALDELNNLGSVMMIARWQIDARFGHTSNDVSSCRAA